MKNRLKFLRSVPGILLVSSAIFIITIAGVGYIKHHVRVSEEKRIVAELEHKDLKDITAKDFRMLFKKSEPINSAELDKFVGNRRVLWIVSQGHGKDTDSINLIGRYTFDIEERAQFFKATVRAISVTDLEGWATRNNAKTNHLPAEPEVLSRGIVSFVKSGEGMLTLVFISVFAGFFIWSIFWGPLSGINRFVRGRELTPEKNTRTFKDVAGADDAVREAKEAVDILNDIKDRAARKKKQQQQKKKKKGAGHGGDADTADDDDTSPDLIKGLLLTGQPGTGKTLIAMAIAGEAGIPFFRMHGSDFVEIYVGVGAKRVRALFSAAKKKAPSIVFIDEIDAVAQERQSDLGFGGTTEQSVTVAALLGEIDGFDKDIHVLVVAATNRPEILDKALLRPGRFTRQIVVDLPDKDGRKAILELHSKNVRRVIAEDVSFETLARETPGFSGDSLRNLINEANILSQRRKRKDGKRKVITKVDFEEAFERVIYGPEKNSHITPEENETFAAHEAGHTIVGHYLEKETGDIMHKASIVQRGNIGGHTQPLWNESKVLKKVQAAARLATQAGGFVAEEIQYDGNVSYASSFDLQQMTALAENMVKKWGMGDLEKLGLRVFERPTAMAGIGPGDIRDPVDEEVKKLTTRARERARTILEAKKERFLHLIERLLEDETITGDDLREILEGEIPAKE